MACMEHICSNKMCGRQFMDNKKLEQCPYCKQDGITNFFDEALDFESPSGDDYDSDEE